MSQFETLRKHPFMLLVLGIIAIDLALMGPAFSSRRTLAAMIGQSWCWVRPFAYSGNRVDLLMLSLASSQLALITVWAFFSNRMRGIRIMAWICVAMALAVVLVIAHQARYNLPDWNALFTFQSLGLLGGLAWFRKRGYRLCVPGANADDRAAQVRRQYTLSDMLVAITVTGSVCMVFSWLAMIWGSGSFFSNWFRWSEPLAELRQVVRMMLMGALGSLLVWACLSERRTSRRVFAALVAATVAGWLAIWATVQYESYVSLSGIERDVIPGWVAWSFLHALLVAGGLLFARRLGFRFLAAGTDRQATPGRWVRVRRTLARVLIVSAIACLLVVGSVSVFIVVPRYRANRQLLVGTQHLGPIFRDRMGGTRFVITRPLDDAAVDAMLRHPVITHLHIQNLAEGDGTLERLPRLQHLRAVHLGSAEVSDEAVKALERALPNASINVVRPLR